jgi:hypothetical protein
MGCKTTMSDSAAASISIASKTRPFEHTFLMRKGSLILLLVCGEPVWYSNIVINSRNCRDRQRATDVHTYVQ